jgi:hypothetical protein
VKKTTKNQLFVFVKDVTTMGYDYTYVAQMKLYRCSKCHTKGLCVTAKLVEDREGDYLKLSKTKHICNPIQYVPELDKLQFPPLVCPTEDEGTEEVVALKTRLEDRHPDTGNQVIAVTYVVTLRGPEAPIEERFSCIPYIGYSEFKEIRLQVM